MRIFPLLLVMLLSMLACNTLNSKNHTRATSALNNLSQIDAKNRYLQVRNIHYTQFFDLTNNEGFSGNNKIQFDYIPNGNPLRIDFSNGKIIKIKLNQNKVDYNYDNAAIYIASNLISEGANELDIEFQKKYSTDAEGLYKFTDSKDKRVYIYSDLEPFNANKVFPSFDQPDLKASYQISVKAPVSWQVITSTLETKKIKNKNNYLWVFPKSEKFSTYIWSLHAGEYKVWHSQADKIPLRLFARQSLAKYINPNIWFEDTKNGFKFFNDFFALNYPYKKYDQILVPDFNPSAMENVAAVTFSEKFIVRGEMSEQHRKYQRNVLLHEMAHMWFGNLVTMKWWDGLWLNESFATYMANLASYEITKGKDNWRQFNNSEKQNTYLKDQLSTTHPIQAKIHDTDQAFANFDAITYGKGAAFLKQLNFYIGNENFKNAMREYFQLYKERNTSLDNFVSTLDRHTDKKLKPWFKDWLETANVNTITSNWTCSSNRISSFQILQSADKNFPQLRAQKTRIAFYNKRNNKFILAKTFDVDFYAQEISEIPSLIGQNCPDFIHPNYDEYAYTKVSFDDTSLNIALKHFNQFTDSIIRDQIALVSINMIRDGNLSASKYLDMILEQLKAENDIESLSLILNSIHGYWRTSASLLQYFPKDKKTDKAKFDKFIMDLENTIWTRLSKAPKGSELQKLFFDSYARIASSKFALIKLKSIISSDQKLKSYKVTFSQKWEAIQSICSNNFENAYDFAKVIADKDNSHEAKKELLACKALLPNLEIKTKLKAQLLDPNNKDSLAQKKVIMYNIFASSKENFRKELSNNYVDEILNAQKTLDTSLVSRLSSISPDTCDESNRKIINPLILNNKISNARLKKELQENIDQGIYCERIRKNFF